MTEISTEQQSSELIDATQNAVIDAVNSISEMIEVPSAHLPQDSEPFYASAEFWVGMAFILTVVCLCRPVGRILKTMLIQRREKIISRINDASEFRDQAQILLAKYERMALNADSEIEKLTQKSFEDIQNYREDKMRLFHADMDKRQKEADRVMQGAFEKALFEMTDKVTKRSLEIVQETLKQKLDIEQKQKLVQLSLQHITENIKTSD